MSTTSNPYQPEPRLIDDRRQLATLYVEQDLTTNEIAQEHAEVSQSMVYQKLDEYGLLDTDEDTNCNRGHDPPQNNSVQWTDLQ